ncbi:hypothetical protein [Thermoflexus sp.]|uniref:hypothetical protein n=1 Tax=Thermoflexus sp. TaxID=1969742 RepID=UPI002ADDFD42|nr:hypothetical protein [Thermoflexus sp.]
MRHDELSIGRHRPIYLWAGPGTIRMNRLKFMGAPVDVEAHLEAYTEAGAQRVAEELGNNWAYLTYNWGFPPEIEQEDWETFEKAAAIYHQRGIRVFAYIQTSNAVFDGSHRARDWFAQDPRGRPIYYYTGRYMTCWLHPDWLAHLRDRIRDAIARGADGIFFDNPWHAAQPLLFARMWLGPAGCYCPRCRRAFQQATGLEIPRSLEPEREEAARLYLRWRAQQVTDTLTALADYARSLRPDIVISANDFDAVMRPSFLIYGIDLAKLARVQDILMIEDYGLPRWDGDRLVNNALTLRTARALAGETPLSTLPYDRGIGFDGVYPPRRFQQAIAEAAACGAILVIKGTEFVEGGTFTVLTAPRYAEQRRAIGTYQRWLADHAALYEGRENCAPLALLHPGDALWAEWTRIAPLYFGAAQTLLDAGIPWRVVRSPDEAMDARVLVSVQPPSGVAGFHGRWIVLSELRGWRDLGRGERPIAPAVRRVLEGIGLGLYRAYFRSRLARRWMDRLQMVHFFVQSPYFQLPPASLRQELLAAIGPIAPRAIASQPVLIEVWRRGSEEQIHLVNYGATEQEVEIQFPSGRSGRWISPDGGAGAFEGDRIRLRLDVYAVLIARR